MFYGFYAKSMERKDDSGSIFLSPASAGFQTLLRLFAAGWIIASFLMLPGCGWDVTKDSDSSSLKGIVTDLEGKPLAGARVTVAGQEADTLTDGSGRWQIASPEVAESAESPATASLPGYETFVGKIGQVEGTSTRLPCYQPDSQNDFINVYTPEAGSVLYMEDICREPTVTIEGNLGGPYDVIFLIDISASMGRAIPWFFGLTPLDILKDALIELLEQFDLGDFQVGVIGFYGSAEILSPLTNEPAEIAAAIMDMEAHEDGTTNYELGLKTAVDLLESTGRPGGQQMIILVSDGIPTAYGYPKPDRTADLLNQDQEDIDGALAGAFYALDTQVQVHGIAIGDFASVNKLTTLPAIADITGGYYLALPNFFDSMEWPAEWTLHGASLLEVMDETGNVHEVPVSIDGAFSASIPVAAGENTLFFTAYKGEGQNQNVFATKERTFTVSTEEGEEGQIECGYTESGCESAIWALYVEYTGTTNANIDIFQGSPETLVRSMTASECDRRIYLQQGDNGPSLTPYLTYKIDWNRDGVYDEVTRIQTSCSEPMGVGYTFGSLQVIAYGHGENREFFEGEFPEQRLDLSASKTYSPSAWCDDRVSLMSEKTVLVPQTLTVTNGNGGNHTAELRFDDVVCTYKGGSSQAHPFGSYQWNLGLTYRFQSCTDGTAAGEAIIAEESFLLHINNGDSLYSPTTVEVTLVEGF